MILLEIPLSHELYFFWITLINKLGGWFWLIITSGGSETNYISYFYLLLFNFWIMKSRHSKLRPSLYNSSLNTGCPKKTLFLGLLAITPLWKGQEIKVRVFLKNSGNSLSDRHQNFSIWPIRSWENWVQRWQPYLKNLDKNGGNSFGWNWMKLIILPTLGLTFCFSLLEQGFTWYSKCGFFCPTQI